jgi:hypothetical protein
MTQQPLLTVSEVVELLKDALPDDETMRNAFWELIVKYSLTYHVD